MVFQFLFRIDYYFCRVNIKNKEMKKIYLYVCAMMCTLGMLTSCSELDANAIAGTYVGELKIAGVSPISKEVTVKAIGENQAEISLAGISLGEVLGSIDVKATCTVISVDGTANLAGSTAISFSGFSFESVPVTGEVEDKTLELEIKIPNYEIEFEGIRK